jgi:hypothetical protein
MLFLNMVCLTLAIAWYLQCGGDSDADPVAHETSLFEQPYLTSDRQTEHE